MKDKILLFISGGAILIGLFLIAVMMYQDAQQEKLNFLAEEKSEVFIRDYSPRYGSEDAKVYLIEFLDPECESCRAFYPKVKSLLEEFEGKVQLVVRYAPFHGNSETAIKALEAARMQGKYWEALETLFRYQPQWGHKRDAQPIFNYLSRLDLDMQKLKKDMKSEKVKHILEQDTQDLKALNVRATPGFFVNGKPLENFGFENLRSLIKDEVQKQYK